MHSLAQHSPSVRPWVIFTTALLGLHFLTLEGGQLYLALGVFNEGENKLNYVILSIPMGDGC